MGAGVANPGGRLLHDTAHSAFKAKHGKYIRWAALCAVVIHAAVFIVTPRITIAPYTLEQQQFEVIEIPDQIELPAPPPDVPPPPVVVRAAEDGAVITEPVPETTFETIADMPPPPPPPPAADGGGGGAQVFLAFDEPPELIEYTAPDYPPRDRRAGVEGVVAIRVLVSEDGKVLDAVVLHSDVTPAMDQAAVQAALRCRFRPAKQRTVPVKAHVMIPFQFNLR